MLKKLAVILICLSVVSVQAQTPEQRGLEIALESDQRDQGFVGYTVELEMILRNRHGDESRRQIRVAVLEQSGDGDKSLTVFDEPADVKGTALLTYSHKTEDDDQWLYLPALKRVKRISSANKSGSFMGSEFAYEDIGSQEVEKYTYRYIQDDVIEAQACFVIDRFPVSKDSGYIRQRVWIDKQDYRPLKIEFYDRKASLLKTLVWQGYRQYKNKYWRADQMLMQNHQSGKSTQLRWTHYRFDQTLKPTDFTPQALPRAH